MGFLVKYNFMMKLSSVFLPDLQYIGWVW